MTLTILPFILLVAFAIAIMTYTQYVTCVLIDGFIFKLNMIMFDIVILS